MTDILILFGFSWMVVSALLGLYLGIIHDIHKDQLEEQAQQGRLHDYHHTLYAYKWRVTVHAHGFLFSLVCVVIALILPKLAYSEMMNNGLIACLMVATVLWTIGGYKESRPMMGIADFMFLAALITTVIGLALAL